MEPGSSKGTWKTRLYEAFQRFIVTSLAFLPFILVLRAGELIVLTNVHILPPGSYLYELRGALSDIPLFFAFALILLVPYLLLYMLHRRAASITLIATYTLLALIWAGLIKYFITTLVPLDQVIFSYNLDEMIMIVQSSTKLTIAGFIPFIALIVLVPLLQFVLHKKTPGRILVIVVASLIALSPFLVWAFNPKPQSFSRDFNYFLSVNKVCYLVQKTRTYQQALKEPEIPDQKIKEAIDRYQERNPDFTYISKTYPLLHTDQVQDVLGSYFDLAPEKPNLVFIIVESLSSAFCGDDPWFGSWTPFLDSLMGHSLYWKNCLATSERTFYVLPGIFASLPYANERFLGDPTQTSYHLSLIRYLRQNGYYTSFFYGGDPSFNQMKEYLTGQETDYILESFGSGFSAQTKAESGFTWGFPDHELFQRSFEVIDSFPRTHRMDIYLTLSMHAPFIPPDQGYYNKLFAKRLGEIRVGSEKKQELRKYKNIFESILYTDDALRKFFKEYAGRKEYDNTIFIITGDHALPELNVGQISLIEKYRVPLIIYSPRLKGGVRFPSVASHLDLTPSLLAMLKSRYGMEIHSSVPWLGRELDTASSYRPRIKMAFVLNNKNVEEYLENQYYLTPSRLFIVTPELETNSVQEPQRHERMKQTLADYLLVTNYTGNRNALVPFWMIFPEKIHEKPFPFPDTTRLPAEMNTGEYISVVPSAPLDTNYKLLRMDISFKLFTGEKDPSKFPPLIFDIVDLDGAHAVWRRLDPVRDARISSYKGSWHTIRYKVDMNISFVKNRDTKQLKLYLWNQKAIPVKYDSLKVIINGFY